MDRPVDKDRQCCYNCINCIAYFGANTGGFFCVKEDCIVYNMLQPRVDCPHFSKGEYQSKSLDEASDYIRMVVADYAVK